MKHILLSSLGLFIVTGCVEPQIINISKPFNIEQAKFIQDKGNNSIKGNAFLKQNGGGIVTCAGNTTWLTPNTEYAKERLEKIYLSSEKGFSSSKGNFKFNPDSQEFYKYMKNTVCDSQGNFKFDNLADGEYFVVATVTWNVGSMPQGGALMQKVSLKNGELKEIVLAY